MAGLVESAVVVECKKMASKDINRILLGAWTTTSKVMQGCFLMTIRILFQFGVRSRGQRCLVAQYLAQKNDLFLFKKGFGFCVGILSCSKRFIQTF